MADYWFIPLHYQGDTHWKWLQADSIEEARADALSCWGPEHNHGVEVGEPVRAGEHEPCTRCPSREVCTSPDNKWEYTHLIKGGVEQEKDERLVVNVHTCRTCMERVLSDYQWKMTERHLVDADCPRWHPIQGSAFNCGWCNAETQRLQKEHPAYEARMAAIKNGFMAALMSPSKAPKGTVDLDKRREIREGAAMYAKASAPFGHLSLENFDEGAGNRAILLLYGLLAELPQYTDLSAEITEHSDAVRLVSTRFQWTEDLYLALTRHQDKPDADEHVLHEWVLRFLDNGGGPVSRGWTRTSVARRKLLIRSWHKTIRELLADPPPETVPLSVVRSLFDL